jgi:pimeloyl-ACP methyl ester carboxylesterase
MVRPLDSRTYETPYGPIVLWGEAEAFASDRPLVVGLAGAFAIPRGPLFNIAQYLKPQADVVSGHLPGNHCPPLVGTSVGLYAAAYSHALNEAFPNRRLIPCGLSIGGLVTLGLRVPAIRRAMVVEPPLVMSKIWPMWPSLRQRLANAPGDAGIAAFIKNVFGVDAASVEERRYDHLLAGVSVPTHVLVGDRPLFPKHEFTALPSLVDEPERALMAANPHIRVSVVQGCGHNVPQENAAGWVGALRDLVAAAAAD